MAFGENWRLTTCECPECRAAGLWRDEGRVLTSYPAQYYYKCDHCGWTGTGRWEGPTIIPKVTAEIGNGCFSFTNQGWECPKCHRVYSPTTPMCLYCGDKQVTITTTTGTIPPQRKTEVTDHVQDQD